MSWNLIIQFIVLTIFISGGIIFALYMVLIKTVDGAKQRLDRDAEAARKREAELNQKIREADAQLQRRKKELDVMEKKMRQELEEQSVKEKSEMINKARTEAEEIIVKAQNAREQIKKEVEKNYEIKTLDYSTKILGEVFSHHVKEAVEKQLLAEFVLKLKGVDFSRLGPDVKTADMITANPMDQASIDAISAIFKEKLGRELTFKSKIDPTVIHGVLLQFDSLLLDGSLRNAFKEAAGNLRQQIEKQYAG